MNDSDHIINGWQALVIMGPSILAFFATCLNAYLGSKKMDKNTEITVQANKKLDNVTKNQEVTHELLDNKQIEIIESIKKSAYVEGILQGLHKEANLIATSLITELKNRELIVKDKENEIVNILNDIVAAKEQLIRETQIVKGKSDHNIEVIKENMIHKLNERFLQEK